MNENANLERDISKLVDELARNGGSMVTLLSGDERLIAEAAEKRGLISIHADGGTWEETEELSLTRRVRLQKGLPPILIRPGVLQTAARAIGAVWASLWPKKA